MARIPHNIRSIAQQAYRIALTGARYSGSLGKYQYSVTMQPAHNAPNGFVRVTWGDDEYINVPVAASWGY